MKILVTGGAGFIGSHIVDAYIAAGHQVSVLDNFSTGQRENVNPKATVYENDIQNKDVKDIIADNKFDVINHQAAQMDVRRSVRDPIFDAKNNVLGLINILKNGSDFGVKKIIFASSGGAIYGEQETFPADENHPLQPYSPYGITKLTGEKYCFFYSLNNLKYVALRYANVYGPRQNPHGEAGVVAIFTQRMLRGEQTMINGTGEQTRDFVYVKDVVKANVLALDHPESDIFNIGTGLETDITTIFRILVEKTQSGQEEKHAPAQPGEQMRSVLDWKKAKQKLNWSPSYKLEDGLEETVEYFKSKSG
jgi:UDP-glucose 4-epimerase